MYIDVLNITYQSSGKIYSNIWIVLVIWRTEIVSSLNSNHVNQVSNKQKIISVFHEYSELTQNM